MWYGDSTPSHFPVIKYNSLWIVTGKYTQTT